MFRASSFIALHCVLIMVAVSAGEVGNHITCAGVKHLAAGRYTVSNCTDCTIVGEPGTILEGPILCSGALNLNGSVALEGKGQPDCVRASPMALNGNVEVNNCKLGPEGNHGVAINGGDHGQFVVSIRNSSTADSVFIDIANNAKVTITDSRLSPMENWLRITDSHVSFERVQVYSEYEGYTFTNSTVIALNTSFGGGHTRFAARDSTLNFTGSNVSFWDGNWAPGISLSNCSVDVTCDAATVVFSTGQLYGGMMGMDIIDSDVRFERCSCHLDRAIRVAGPLSVQKSSVIFGWCQEFGKTTKGHTSVPVVV